MEKEKHLLHSIYWKSIVSISFFSKIGSWVHFLLLFLIIGIFVLPFVELSYGQNLEEINQIKKQLEELNKKKAACKDHDCIMEIINEMTRLVKKVANEQVLTQESETLLVSKDVCQSIKSKTEIRELLEQWHDHLSPIISQTELSRVSTYANRFPVNQPPNVLSISFDISGDNNIQRVVNRRDWAYALEGLRYTLIGGLNKGSEKMIDVGFWCFLKAALLRMEPNHLANIGFHLNNKGAFGDAASILCFARSLNNGHSNIHNNLAHTLASTGNYSDALAEQAAAMVLNP